MRNGRWIPGIDGELCRVVKQRRDDFAHLEQGSRRKIPDPTSQCDLQVCIYTMNGGFMLRRSELIPSSGS